MTEDLCFDSVRRHFAYGLVRLSGDFVIADKNIKAERTHVFPRRGAGVIKYTEDAGAGLFLLKEKEGENIAVSFKNGDKAINAVAIRERNGSILLLLHPLISAASLGRGGKMPKAYAINILKIIYGENIENNFSGEEFFSAESIAIKRPVLITTAVKSISEKLNKTNFKSSITFDLGSMRLGLSRAVDFNTVIYALTEILALENTFSDGKSAKINFTFTEETLDITLVALMKGKNINDGKMLSRLFSEALLLFGINASVQFDSNGFISARASVNSEIAGSTVREPIISVFDAIWGYFDYGMEYYGFGEE